METPFAAWGAPDLKALAEGMSTAPQQWMAALANAMPAPKAPAVPDGFGVQIDPVRALELQREYVEALSTLWSSWSTGKRGVAADKRFGSESWNGPYGYFADLYLLNARYVAGLADAVDADAKTRAKIRFAIHQWIDAMAPSNFLALNPDALKKLLDTKGESLKNGLSLFLADAQKGRVSITDETAFEVGRNVALSPGEVVFENEIFQLIQYTPLTDSVFEKPLLMVPPCINKYYILDLQPENSVVRHAISEGHTVFLVSWRNPMAAQASLTWDDYIEDGVIRAIDVVRKISAQKTINILGFCVGGTMLTTALAVLAAREKGADAQPAASLTLLTTLLDFSDTGVLDVFVDEESVRQREQTLGGMGGGKPGLMPARDLATSFAFLRPNDLVWNYVVSSYLKGEPPPPFDLLFWNADSTNLPGPFFVWYLRNTYLENRLKVPGANDGVRRRRRPRSHRIAGVHLRLARGPHRALAIRVCEHADSQGRQALRARRVGTHRGRDQPAGEEEAQSLHLRPAEGTLSGGRGLHGSRRRPKCPAAGGPSGSAGSTRTRAGR